MCTSAWCCMPSRRAGRGEAGLIILGLDPSLSCTGWGVIRIEGSRLTHIANGQIATSNDTGATWTLQPKRIGAPQALFAQRGTDGQIETILVADGAVLRTVDGGATVEKLL